MLGDGTAIKQWERNKDGSLDKVMKEISSNAHLLSTAATQVADEDLSKNVVLEQGTDE
jgi:hypothetical protein